MDNIYQYKVTPQNNKSIIRSIVYTNTDTQETFEAQEVYRNGYFILELREKIVRLAKTSKKNEFNVSNYKIINYELDEVTYSDIDTDLTDELEDKGLLDEKSRYYISGPVEFTKLESQ